MTVIKGSGANDDAVLTLTEERYPRNTVHVLRFYDGKATESKAYGEMLASFSLSERQAAELKRNL